MKHVMLDLETMGTSPFSAIIQIGAVEFSSHEIGRSFKVNVSLESCVSYGLKIEPKTAQWWMNQSDGARTWLSVESLSLHDALQEFSNWLGNSAVCIWGDGLAFDNVLLRCAYQVAGIKCPWSFTNDRCFRTMKNMFPVEHIVSDIPHDALCDAMSQAQQMMSMLKTNCLTLQ